MSVLLMTEFRMNEKAEQALKNQRLQKALTHINSGFVKKRKIAMSEISNFEALRDEAAKIKDHCLDNLDHYLIEFESNVKKNGGKVHWASDCNEACQIVLQLLKQYQAKNIIKSKSMITEEIHLNDFLEQHDFNAIESDLGEYIIQLRKEKPTHIVAPALHLIKEQIRDDFKHHHLSLDPNRQIDDINPLVDEAREILREKYFKADVGITGANFLIADTGTCVTVTNEGNADLTQLLPKVHLVITSIEKVVPRFNEAATLIRLLGRSATGQAMTAYTTFFTGKKRIGDCAGVENFHVILLDNGRSTMLKNNMKKMLRCIRCGACMNHCPVYAAVGGHAYGWVYPGPMGIVLTSNLTDGKKYHSITHASTFCGKCETVCPVKIPLTSLMRNCREKEYNQHLDSTRSRFFLTVWGFLVTHPKLYRMLVFIVRKIMRLSSKNKTYLTYFPLLKNWTKFRFMTVPSAFGCFKKKR